MSGTITIRDLKDAILTHVMDEVYQPEFHPPDFRSKFLRDMGELTDEFSGDQMRRIDLERAQGILARLEGSGSVTSVNLEKVAQEVSQRIADPATDLGRRLAPVTAPKIETVGKADFIARAKERFPGASSDLDRLAPKLPDRIAGRADVDAAIGALDSDYYGPLDDVVDGFDDLKAGLLGTAPAAAPMPEPSPPPVRQPPASPAPVATAAAAKTPVDAPASVAPASPQQELQNFRERQTYYSAKDLEDLLKDHPAEINSYGGQGMERDFFSIKIDKNTPPEVVDKLTNDIGRIFSNNGIDKDPGDFKSALAAPANFGAPSLEDATHRYIEVAVSGPEQRELANRLFEQARSGITGLTPETEIRAQEAGRPSGNFTLEQEKEVQKLMNNGFRDPPPFFQEMLAEDKAIRDLEDKVAKMAPAAVAPVADTTPQASPEPAPAPGGLDPDKPLMGEDISALVEQIKAEDAAAAAGTAGTTVAAAEAVGDTQIKVDPPPVEAPRVQFLDSLAKNSGLVGGAVIGAASGGATWILGGEAKDAAQSFIEGAVPYGETAIDLVEGDVAAAAHSATVETVSNGASIAGGAIGGVVGQILIPIPVVGAAVGGAAGALIVGAGTGVATDWLLKSETAQSAIASVKNYFNGEAAETQVAMELSPDEVRETLRQFPESGVAGLSPEMQSLYEFRDHPERFDEQFAALRDGGSFTPEVIAEIESARTEPAAVPANSPAPENQKQLAHSGPALPTPMA